MLDWFSHSRMLAEWNSARATSPHPGQILRDYSFREPNGKPLVLSDFRGRSNLVLIMLPETRPSEAHLLHSLTEKSAEVRGNETRVLVVTYPEHLFTVVNLGGDSVFLSDADGSPMLELGAAESPGSISPTKRSHRPLLRRPHPYSGDEILSWVRYAAAQCPECNPPEWPADDVA